MQAVSPRQGACKRILAVVGTRPEAIKMAPVIRALQSAPWADVRVLATAQHRQMLDQVLDAFGIVPDIDLDIMAPNQTLPELTSRLLSKLDEVFARERPDAVLIQGDTTTVMTAAMAAFYRRIDVGHVEAGLRTGDLHNPFPEEMNRIVAGRLSRWHFAPTEGARDNLLREGFDPASVHVTGNTVIDALLDVVQRDTPLPVEVPEGRRMVLVTAHRRENFGAPFREVCLAIRDLADRHDDVHFVYPVHPNPNVSGPAREILGGHDRITLCPPMDYLPFVAAMKRAHLILTDSGGVQEEAPALGKPVLVMRRETERPEAVEAGVVKLVGPVRDAIVAEVSWLLDEPGAYAGMAKGVSPYGDGHASGRIADILGRDLIG
ncbi:UDP-N-acetylglucosamine 2-epimerase (non-hydrolyzing) [Pseudoluteimonas lycopersici]|uniref:UDP-N-acetylglucosamine 2-epimerase (non-hydrolyzing) n=2 Tax=Pseudoluteimonas lycopersici TaxID=1324796 RepID=A0A516V8J0_9GAMM|nr:UDP-N-acetylglucosamine 2-epimerase (non-hydrolyzing) [Lysobacter lycopersici]